MTSRNFNRSTPALGTLAALLAAALAGCSGSGDSDDTVAVNGDVAIAYAQRVNTLSMNPTDGATFAAGGDLIIREKSSPSAPEHNVTRAYTRGHGDVSDPEVSYDGKKVVFAMNCPTGNNAAIGIGGLHGPLEHLGVHAARRRLRRRHDAPHHQLDHRRRRRSVLPAGRRLRVRIEPPDQDAHHAGGGHAAVLRAR